MKGSDRNKKPGTGETGGEDGQLGSWYESIHRIQGWVGRPQYGVYQDYMLQRTTYSD